MNFTPDQQKIIDARDCSILVSAAAGSGKTAVMVERILGLICDEPDENGKRVDIDRLLIVTFTRAAAAQMKEKIANAIEKRLAENPEDTHLQRQSALIANAQITTIDSFCLFILRNNFADIDLDPGFRIADEGEVKLLKSDVLAEVIENYYENGDEDFVHMAECISTGSEDTAIEKMVIKLFDAANSNPWPEKWLDERLNDYATPDDKLGGLWYEQLTKTVKERLEEILVLLKNAQKIILLPDGPYMYSETVENDIAQVEQCIKTIENEACTDYDELRAKVEIIDFKGLKPCRDKSVNPVTKERASGLRKKSKARLDALIGGLLFQPQQTHVRQMKECDRILKSLIGVTRTFMDSFNTAMRERGMLSFSDCEHLALNIMVRPTENGYEYTDTAAEYRKYFDYVMIDEYQDSNLIQELLLSAVSGEPDGKYNRFMVGDIKQSIYRFRQARPEIFMKKYKDYDANKSGDRLLVDLHKNFRSRSSVLDVVNGICESLMSESVGGVTYDDKAALHLGAGYQDDADGNFTAELNIYEKDNEDGLDSKEIEAKGIALRIEQMISEGVEIKDGDNPEDVRKIRYGDVVILLRKTDGYAEVFSRVLTERGIPVHVSGLAGYFTTYEIKTLLHFLKIIVNPLQDIGFYGVLTSVIGGFTPSEAAQLKILYGEQSRSDEPYLYAACKYVAETEGHDSLRIKTAHFLKMLEKYRAHSEYMGVEELLCEILRDTDYRTVMYAMKDGEKRLANIDMLLKKASDYAQTSYFGLYNFLRYVDMVQKFEIGVAESETINENADVVRIMTIHKSKGLEFPVCFVAGLGGQLNRSDYTSFIVLDGDYGLGMKYIDIDRRIQGETLRRNIVAERIKSEQISEELRVLYVALTRAKEKLILSGVMSNPGDKLGTLTDMVGEKGVMPSAIRSEITFLSWIMLSMVQKGYGEAASEFIKDGEDILDMPDLSMRLKYLTEDDVKTEEAAGLIDRQVLKLWLADLVQEDPDKRINKTTGVTQYLDNLCNAEYSHCELSGMFTKASVSDLKHAVYEEQAEGTVDACPAELGTDDVRENDAAAKETDRSGDACDIEKTGGNLAKAKYVPRFISQVEDKPGATVRGSAFHRIMELVNFDLFIKELGDNPGDTKAVVLKLREQTEAMLAAGKISSVQKEIMTEKNLNTMARIFDSDVMKRMAVASGKGCMYKEAPFMLGVPANEINSEFPEEETILIQGIIDAYWQEEGGYVILDYKTDRVREASQLIKNYKVQLDWYERALESMNMHVKEKLIYSFELNEFISI